MGAGDIVQLACRDHVEKERLAILFIERLSSHHARFEVFDLDQDSLEYRQVRMVARLADRRGELIKQLLPRPQSLCHGSTPFHKGAFGPFPGVGPPSQRWNELRRSSQPVMTRLPFVRRSRSSCLGDHAFEVILV